MLPQVSVEQPVSCLLTHSQCTDDTALFVPDFRRCMDT